MRPYALLLAFMLAAPLALDVLAQSPPDALDLVKQGRKLETAGDLDAALALYERAMTLDPTLFDAHLAAGRALDLKGDYEQGRKHLAKAIEVAPEASRNAALTAMGIAYAFEGKAAEAAKFFQQVFDKQIAAQAFDEAAATANALGRIYLESGDFKNAAQWYRTGKETAARIANLPADQGDLWAMRWHHAQARIAARTGDLATAKQEAAAVKALIDKNETNEKEMPIYQYLAGYVAFYAKDYDTAIAELLKGDQSDPFILGLIGQAYEKKGDAARAREFYTKVLASNSHGIPSAVARPIARRAVR